MRVILSLLVLFSTLLPVFSVENAQVWNPYLQKIEKEAKASWYKASGLTRHDRECKINLFFNVKNTGEVSQIKVLGSDCTKEMNELAIQALKDVAPFEPFPKAVFNIKEISIDFIFDYRLLPENRVSQPSESLNIPAQSVVEDIKKPVENKVEANKSVVENQTVKQDLNKDKNKNMFVLLSIFAAIVVMVAIFYICKFFKLI